MGTTYIPLLLATVIISIVFLKRALVLEHRSKFQKRFLHRPQPSLEEMRGLIEKYGNNSNAFFVLYNGFRYYRDESESQYAIGYVETSGAWVAVGEPLCPPEYMPSLLKSFARDAHLGGKVAIFIPVSAQTAEIGKQIGFGSVQVGSEPIFELDRYPPPGKDWLEMVSTAKILSVKGARVDAFKYENLSAEKKQEFESITQEWLSSRKMAALDFLNRVEPWTRHADKRYFAIELKGKTLAFIAAVPIWPRKSWYLVDVMRKIDTPPGTTELLILQTMRALRNEGAKEITLGVAPLSGLKDLGGLFYKTLHLVHDKGNIFYNFKSLHQFKLKFGPTRFDSTHILFSTPRFNLKILNGVSDAFQPAGVRAVFSSLRKLRPGLFFANLIKGQLAKSIVVRSAPTSLWRLFLRCRLTAFLFMINILVFVFVNERTGILDSDIEKKFGFSWMLLSSKELYRLFLPAFLHWHFAHLNFNLICLLFFTGGLEYLTGTQLAALCYFVPSMTANILSILGFSLTLSHWNQELWLKIASGYDLGASLGTFGCAGALSHFLKYGRFLIALVVLISLVMCIVQENALALNHMMSVFIGWLILHFYLKIKK